MKKLVTSEDEEGNAVSEEKEVVEGGVLVWGNENAPAMDTLRAAIKEFYGGNAPKVLDPFAGGGAIPLEAMRLGCEVTSADLNPVAWFIQKCTLDYPQRFAGKKWPLPDFVREWPDFVEDFIAGKIKKRKGDKKPHFTDSVNLELHDAAREVEAPSDKASADFKKVSLPDADLAWHVRAWGRWVLERARQELAARYPDGGWRANGGLPVGAQRARPADNWTNPAAQDVLAAARRKADALRCCQFLRPMGRA